MHHEPFTVSLSGSCRRSRLCWPTLDKEAFATMEVFKRADWLLWGETTMIAALIIETWCISSKPSTVATKLSKATSQRLPNGRPSLGNTRIQFNMWRVQQTFGGVTSSSRVGLHYRLAGQRWRSWLHFLKFQSVFEASTNNNANTLHLIGAIQQEQQRHVKSEVYTFWMTCH